MKGCKYNKVCPILKSNIETSNTIYVIGDLHADYKKTVELFKYFKLIDKNKRWIGKNSIVVQLGDQIDGYGRGNYEDAHGEIQILDFFDNTNIQAQSYGGAVYSLIGNHELMNVMGNFSYASKKDIEETGGKQNRQQLFKPGGCMATRLSCTRNTLLKINDIIFVHAGIVPEIVKENKKNTITYVNLLMKNFFNGETGINDNINKFLIDSKGVLWDRSLGKDNANCDILDKTLKDLGCEHIVIGHTPQNIINSRCNEKVWRVDVGLSKSLGNNKFQILEIKRNNNKSSFRILS
jgi:hypothetical protein